MTDAAANTKLKLRAHSPGEFPILAVETAEGELRLLYYETGYDLDQFKPASEDWLRDNAVGRHSFVKLDPARDITPEELKNVAQRGTVDA